MAVEDWVALEKKFRQYAHFLAGPFASLSSDEQLSWFKEQSVVAERLTYQGEVVLMFADAATNALTEAILGSWGEGGKRPTFLRFIRGLRPAEREPDLSHEVDRLWAVYLGVNLPRHVLAVHPPDGRSTNAFHIGESVHMGWIRPWDPEDGEWQELSASVRAETPIPDDMAATPDRLLAWVVDNPEGLSKLGRNRLASYARANGIFVSPTRAAARAQELIRDLARVFGYRREDFFSD
jgi:hypothetical protein